MVGRILLCDFKGRVEMSFTFAELRFPSCKDENKPNF